MMQGQPGMVMMGGEQQMPGMQFVSEPVAAGGMQMPIGTSMQTMSMPEQVTTMISAPATSMPVATGAPGALISNMPVYGGMSAGATQMPAMTAPPVYMDQMAMTSAPAIEMQQAAPVFTSTYSAPEMAAGPFTYAGPPTTVVAPPVYMNQQPVTTAVIPPTTATSIAPPVYVEAPLTMAAPQQMEYLAPMMMAPQQMEPTVMQAPMTMAPQQIEYSAPQPMVMQAPAVMAPQQIYAAPQVAP